MSGFNVSISRLEIVLSSPRYPGNPAIAAVKATGRARFRRRPRPEWVFPYPGGASAVLDLGAHVKMSPQVAADLRDQVRKQRERIEASRAPAPVEADDFVVTGVSGTPRPYQTAGVAAIVRGMKGKERYGVILADEMGLGKTIQAISVIAMTKAPRVCVVVPPAVRIQWQREVEKWIPGTKVEILTTQTPKPIGEDTRVAVIGYSTAYHWADVIAKWGPAVVVADESHRVKEASTKQAKGVAKISKSARLVLLMSGTPMRVGAHDYLNQLRICGRLDEFGGADAFRRRYVGTKTFSKWDPKLKKRVERRAVDKGVSLHLDELNHRLRSSGALIRRKVEDVLKDLPELGRYRHAVEVDGAAYRDVMHRAEKQRRAHIAACKRAEKEGKEPPAGGGAISGILMVRKILGALKIRPCADYISELIDEGGKVVVFAHHREVVEGLSEILDCPKIYGGMTPADRQAGIDRFQDDEACRAIVVNLTAGSEGLNLTAGFINVFVESSLVEAENQQAEKRTHRMGQTRPVSTYFLDAVQSGGGLATLDHWVAELNAKRREEMAQGVDGKGSIEIDLAQRFEEMMEESEE